MARKTFFILLGLAWFVFVIYGCSGVTGEEEPAAEEPATYRITEGACGRVVFEERIGTDSTSAVTTVRQRKIEWFGHTNFTIESTRLEVEDMDGTIPEEKFYGLHILDEDSLHLHSVSEVITDTGDLYLLKWCPD